MAERKNQTKRTATKKKAPKTTPTKVTVKRSVASTATPKKTNKKSDSKRSFKMPKFLGIFRPFVAYFTGAWYELRQVRWPDRKSSWGLTLAVILFSLFFAGIILGLDYVFQMLFKQILL